MTPDQILVSLSVLTAAGFLILRRLRSAKKNNSCGGTCDCSPVTAPKHDSKGPLHEKES